MLKEGGSELFLMIAELFSAVLREGADPEPWKRTRLKVLFKKGDPKSLEKYRPIAITPILYKPYSRVLHDRVKSLVERCASRWPGRFSTRI